MSTTVSKSTSAGTSTSQKVTIGDKWTSSRFIREWIGEASGTFVPQYLYPEAEKYVKTAIKDALYDFSMLVNNVMGDFKKYLSKYTTQLEKASTLASIGVEKLLLYNPLLYTSAERWEEGKPAQNRYAENLWNMWSEAVQLVQQGFGPLGTEVFVSAYGAPYVLYNMQPAIGLALYHFKYRKTKGGKIVESEEYKKLSLPAVMGLAQAMSYIWESPTGPKYLIEEGQKIASQVLKKAKLWE